MPEIVLTTLNAKYIHAAFGLRYLLANLGELQPSAEIIEFDINQRPLDIVEGLLTQRPKILGFGVYIWNVTQTTQVIASLKRLAPEVKIIIGGPEVSYETAGQRVVELSDYVISGEADRKFAQLCQALVSGQAPAEKIIAADPPDFSDLALPYELYDAQDIAHRIIYVEASRGCPFSCEFCLSSLEIPVRQAPLPALLAHLQKLLERGVRQFKFVDRTFNLNLGVSRTLLEFFLERHRSGLFYHFEMIPDRLPAGLREIIARFPAGSLQFEVGIQTFNQQVAHLISRRQDYAKLEDNLQFLARNTGVHVHADLIVGLPGESLESFAAGFDRLVALGPQEIQVGILKRLRGTPIVRHDSEWQMVYDPHPPYEILRNRSIDFPTMQRLRRFARYWDLVANSGNFVETTPLLWSKTIRAGLPDSSPFYSFLRWTDWLHGKAGRTDSIALLRLMQFLFEFLTVELELDPKLAAANLWRDYQRGGRRDKPGFLKDHLGDIGASEINSRSHSGLPKRQARHARMRI
ncbi:MAG TPA: DUF4080 domain-containing protein [Verrucomicrobiae bacterium]|nr:DUF4080 domain-containing protein [Verrucomicrobiae bacterium]